MLSLRRLVGMGCVGLLLCLLWGTLGGKVVSAHAELVSSNPVDGSSVQGPVQDVLLNFGEGVKHMSDMTIKDNQGNTYKVGSYSYNGKQVVVHLADPLPKGAIRFSWTTLSEDGHESPGSLKFTVGNGETNPPKKTTNTHTTESKHSNVLVTVLLGILFLLIIIGFFAMLRRQNKK